MVQAAVSARSRTAPICLLVEDSKFDQVRCKRIMSKSVPMDLIIASTLKEARRYLEMMPFDLILLDNALPDGFGVDFASEIRSFSDQTDTPIVMVSDWPSPFMYDKANSAKVAMILSKDEFHPRHIQAAMFDSRFTPQPRH